MLDTQAHTHKHRQTNKNYFPSLLCLTSEEEEHMFLGEIQTLLAKGFVEYFFRDHYFVI